MSWYRNHAQRCHSSRRLEWLKTQPCTHNPCQHSQRKHTSCKHDSCRHMHCKHTWGLSASCIHAQRFPSRYLFELKQTRTPRRHAQTPALVLRRRTRQQQQVLRKHCSRRALQRSPSRWPRHALARHALAQAHTEALAQRAQKQARTQALALHAQIPH